MAFRRFRSLLGALAVLAASSALAQNYPFPAVSSIPLTPNGSTTPICTVRSAPTSGQAIYDCSGASLVAGALLISGPGGFQVDANGNLTATSCTGCAGTFNNLTLNGGVNSDNQTTLLLNGTQTATGSGAVVGMRVTEVFAPTTATNVDAIQLQHHLGAATANIANFEGLFVAAMTIDAGYAGTTPAITQMEACNSYVDSRAGGTASNPSANFYCFSADPIQNAAAATTGTAHNYQFAAASTTAAAAAGGTVINAAYQAVVPAGGSSGGTTTNYGIYLTGNGGTNGTGTTTNWGVYYNGTADSQLAGGLDNTPIGQTTMANGSFTNLVAFNFSFNSGTTYSGASWGNVSPVFNLLATTLNDTTTGSGGVVNDAAYTIQAPTITNTQGTANTLTTASTLSIAAPVCGSGWTACTNLYSLNSIGMIHGQTGITTIGAASTINANSNFTTSINTGTSTGIVHIADGSGNNQTIIGNGTGLAVFKTPIVSAAGTAFTVASGTGACASSGSLHAGVQAGDFACTGSTGASTVTLTLVATTTSYICWGRDVTTPTTVTQTGAKSTTSVTLTLTSVTANDVIMFGCLGY